MNDGDTLDLAPETAPAEVEKSGFWGKLKKGLFMTHTEFLDRLDAAVEGRSVMDEEMMEHLEEVLIGTDVGVETALEVIESVKERVRGFEASYVLKLLEMLVD